MIDGIHVWPLIRILVTTEIILKTIPKIPENNRNRKFNSFLFKLFRVVTGNIKFLKKFILDYSKNDLFKKQADTIFLGDQVSRVLVNNKWYDRFCDPIIDKLKDNGFSALHMEPLHQYITPRYNPGIFLQPHLDWLRVKSLLKLKTDFNMDNLEGFSEFEIILKEEWNITINTSKLLSSIDYLKQMSNLFDRIIKRVNPLVCFVVCYYGIEGMAFNLACRRNGILSVDIQHGVQGDYHRAYGKWECVPKGGYELLPNIFWVWGEDEAKAIEKWNGEVGHIHKPFIGGNPWLDICDERPEVFYDSIIYDSIKTIQQPKVKLLFCLSGLLGYGVTIPDWMLNFISNSPADWLWLFRLHPCELSEREGIKSLLAKLNSNAQIDVDIATDLPLPILMQNVDVHITHWSTTTIEAAIFGIPTIVVDEKGLDYFINQIPEELLLYANDESSFSESINTALNRKSLVAKTYENRLSVTVAEIMQLKL